MCFFTLSKHLFCNVGCVYVKTSMIRYYKRNLIRHTWTVARVVIFPLSYPILVLYLPCWMACFLQQPGVFSFLAGRLEALYLCAWLNRWASHNKRAPTPNDNGLVLTASVTCRWPMLVTAFRLSLRTAFHRSVVLAQKEAWAQGLGELL